MTMNTISIVKFFLTKIMTIYNISSVVNIEGRHSIDFDLEEEQKHFDLNGLITTLNAIHLLRLIVCCMGVFASH